MVTTSALDSRHGSRLEWCSNGPAQRDGGDTVKDRGVVKETLRRRSTGRRRWRHGGCLRRRHTRSLRWSHAGCCCRGRRTYEDHGPLALRGARGQRHVQAQHPHEVVHGACAARAGEEHHVGVLVRVAATQPTTGEFSQVSIRSIRVPQGFSIGSLNFRPAAPDARVARLRHHLPRL